MSKIVRWAVAALVGATAAIAVALNLVGPADASENQLRVHTDSGFEIEGYAFERGETIYARAAGSSLSPTVTYRIRILDPAGTVKQMSDCSTGQATITTSYTTVAGDPLSTSTMWKARLDQYTSTTECTTTPTAPSGNDDIDDVAVGAAFAFGSQVEQDACTSSTCANTRGFFRAGDTAYVRVLGFTPSQASVGATWEKPDGSTACTATTASDAEGRVSIAYPGAACPDIDATGLWKLVLGSGATTAEFDAFNVDATDPAIAVTFPTASSYTAASWNNGCTTDGLCGTVSDSGGAGVGSVKVSLRQGTGNYWDGDGFDSAAQVFSTATVTSGTWSFPFPASSFPDDGSYTAVARAADNAGNEVDASAVTFKYDTSTPVATVAFPAAGGSYGINAWSTPCGTLAGDICGTASDATAGVSSVTVTVMRDQMLTDMYWDGDGFDSLSPVDLPATGTTSWSLSFPASNFPATGTYVVQATAADHAGNTATSPSTSFTIDPTAPNPPSTPDLTALSDLGSADDDDITADATPTFAGTAEAGSTVKLFADGGTSDPVVEIGSAVATGGDWTITSSTLVDGVYSIRASATDGAANTSTASSALPVTVDTTAPSAPSPPDLSAASDTGRSDSDNLTNNVAPTFTGTVSAGDAGSLVRLYVGGVATGTEVTASGTTWTATAEALGEGPNTMTARAKDVAGNESVSSPDLMVTVDVTAPAVPSTPDLIAGSDSGRSTTDNTTSDSTPSFDVVVEDHANTDAVELFVDGAAAGEDVDPLPETPNVPASDTYQPTSATLASDGVKSATARALDLAGNASAASGALSFTLDTAAPAVPTTPDMTAATDSGSSSSDNVTSNRTPTFTGTAANEDDIRVWLIVGGTDVDFDDPSAPTIAGSRDYALTPTANLTEATHSVAAKTEDLAGNRSAATSAVSVTIDATAPAAPPAPDLATASDTGESSTDNLTNDKTPAFEGSAEAASVVKVFADDGAAGAYTEVGSGTADATGSWAATASDLTDEVGKLILVNATDAAGNVSGNSTALAISVDTLAPASPSEPDLVAPSDSAVDDDDITSDSTPSFDVVTADPANTDVIELLVDGTEVAEDADPETDTPDVPATDRYLLTSLALTDGAKSVTARAVDHAGNGSPASSALSLTIDTTAPPAPSPPDLATGSDTGRASDDDVTADDTPTFTGTESENGTTAKLLFDGVEKASATVSSGAYSLTPSSASAGGTYEVTVKVIDTAGNQTAAAAALEATIDTTAPGAVTPDLDPASDTGSSTTDDITSDTSPTFVGMTDPNAGVELFRGGSSVATADADADGVFSVTDPGPASEGAHDYRTRITDLAGNESSLSPVLTVTVDTNAPAVPTALDLAAPSDSGSSTTDNVTNDTTPTISGAGPADTTIRLYVDGVQKGSATSNAGGAWSIDSTLLTDGTRSVTARSADGTGNESADSAALSIVVDSTAPTTLVTSPANASAYNEAAWDAGCSSGAGDACGTASDAGTGGIASTEVSFKRSGTSLFWDGDGFDSASEVFLVATGTTSWTRPFASANHPADGSYVVGARTTDVAGNTSTTVASTYTWDETAPTPAYTFPTAAGHYNDTTWNAGCSTSGSGDLCGTVDDAAGSGATRVDVSVQQGSSGRYWSGTLFLPGSEDQMEATLNAESWSMPFEATDFPAEGDYTFRAYATDAAGNVSTAVTLTITIDRTAPAAPSTPDLAAASDTGASSTDNLTNDATPTFSGTAPASSTVKVLSGGTEVGSGAADATGNWSVTTSSLTDGVKSITATATDAAGNTSPASSALPVTIDTAAPASPSAPDLEATSDTGASSTDNVTVDSTPTFNGTAANGSAVKLLASGTEVGSATADSTTGAWSITSTALTNGTYSVTATATDTAGNTSVESAGLGVTITDTSPPAAPSTPDLTSASDTGVSSTDNITNDDTPTFTGTAAPGATLKLYVNNLLNGMGVTADGTTGAWSITATTLADGVNAITTTASTGAGGESVRSSALPVTVDTLVPAAPSAADLVAASDTGSSSTDNVTSDTTPTFTGTAEPRSAVTLFVNSSSTGTGVTTGSGAWSITTPPLSDGTKSVAAIATDVAGNTSGASGTLTVVVDTRAPSASQGYSFVGADGSVYAFGTANNLGDMRGGALNAPIISVAYTPGGNGYWLVASDGGVFTFGDARFHGSMGAQPLNAAVIGIAETPTGKGYWLFASDGGIFSFGDAKFFGSMGSQRLNSPVVGMTATKSGKGYWLVAGDGGVFTFGDASFYGSTGATKINQPVFDIAPTETDRGYWLVARDGGIFSFGDAANKFYGSGPQQSPPPQNVIGIGTTPTSRGYWIADASGAAYAFGDAVFLGDRRAGPNPAPMVAFATVPKATA